MCGHANANVFGITLSALVFVATNLFQMKHIIFFIALHNFQLFHSNLRKLCKFACWMQILLFSSFPHSLDFSQKSSVSRFKKKIRLLGDLLVSQLILCFLFGIFHFFEFMCVCVRKVPIADSIGWEKDEIHSFRSNLYRFMATKWRFIFRERAQSKVNDRNEEKRSPNRENVCSQMCLIPYTVRALCWAAFQFTNRNCFQPNKSGKKNH